MAISVPNKFAPSCGCCALNCSNIPTTLNLVDSNNGAGTISTLNHILWQGILIVSTTNCDSSNCLSRNLATRNTFIRYDFTCNSGVLTLDVSLWCCIYVGGGIDSYSAFVSSSGSYYSIGTYSPSTITNASPAALDVTFSYSAINPLCFPFLTPTCFHYRSNLMLSGGTVRVYV